jgi:hypothetical protein
MRPLLASLALLVVACTETAPRPPPTDRFIYPSGIVHQSVPGKPGVLYVASANFDRCFDQGTVIAVDLEAVRTLVPDNASGVPLPAIGAAAASAEPLQLGQLGVKGQALPHVIIQSFASDMALWTPSDGATSRLFIPTRSDGDFLQVVEVDKANASRLTCLGIGGTDCSESGVELTRESDTQGELPRAPAPIGVAVSQEGTVWVTHLTPASTREEPQDFESYVVSMNGGAAADATAMRNSATFHRVSPLGNLPEGGTHAAAIGERYVFVTGRYASGVSDANSTRRFLIRAVDGLNPSRVLDLGVDLAFAALDARGLALDSAQKRLYVAVRSPDALLVVDVLDATTDRPRLAVVGVVPMPDGPSQVKTLRRNDLEGLADRSDLVVVSSSEGGVVSIYDPDVGQVVAQVPVGEESDANPQPYGLALQRAETGKAARIFVSNFGDGRISVIDISDLARPQAARLVAWLGVRQDSTEAVGAGTCQEVFQ